MADRIRKIDTKEEYWFHDMWPNVSNPSAEWLLAQGYEFCPVIVSSKTIEDYCREAKERISSGFRNAIQNGSVVSASQSGFLMDARRNEVDNDIDNIRGMIKRIIAGKETEPVYWVGVSEIRTMMRTDLEIMELELIDYGVSVYQKKHMLEYQLANCTTIEQCEAVVW